MLTDASQHVPIYLQQFPSYSNRKCKNSRFRVLQTHIFVSSRDVPATTTLYFPWMKRELDACQTPSQHVSIYLEYFPSYTMLKLMRKSKNRYFYYILVSPGDAPVAITLNVVCIER